MRLSLLILLALPNLALAQSNAKVPDPDPELERKTFVVPDGFEVNLFAADPMLAKPIQMNFDPQGRLWVAASEVYPQIKPGQTPTDRVLILEDTKGTGKADKTTVFAQGLLIPTGVAPGDGGAYVADSTDLVHYSDPDPATGMARKKRVVLSGFGTEDTHHILHTFRWGPEGRLYMNQSIYIHSHIETPHGVKRLNAGGFWRFRPESLELEVFARGLVNGWGTQFDRWGATFATDGAGGDGINYLVPGAYYATAANAARTLPGLNPGSPKHCGLAIVSGRHMPDDWQGNMITNDFRGHRVCRFVVKPDGSGYNSVEQQEVIKSTHPAFRPIDVAMGPDGAIYVADWYNPIIQHGEVDFRDPRRDKTHGRIWRITAKNRPLVPKPKLVGEPVAALLEQLKAPEEWTRLAAKRVLIERGAEQVTPELRKWLAALDPKDAAFEHNRLEALWLFQGLDVPDAALLEAVLKSPEAQARATACRVVGQWAGRFSATDARRLEPLVVDPHPRVRLEAVRALAAFPEATSAAVAARALKLPVDTWLDYALWQTLRELSPTWLDEVRAGRLDFGDPAALVFALKAAGSGDGLKPIVTLLKSGKVAPERRGDLLVSLAQLGGADEVAFAVREAAGVPAERRAVVLDAAADSVAGRKLKLPTAGIAEALKPMLADTAGAALPAACRLAGALKLDALRPELEGLTQLAATHTDAVRRSALSAIAQLLDAKAKLDAYAAGGDDLALRRLALVQLAPLDTPRAAVLAAGLLPKLDAAADVTEVVTAFTARKGGAAELARAIGPLKLPANVAKVGVQAARAGAQPELTLAEAFGNAGNLAGVKWAFKPADAEQFLKEVATAGDPARGEAIFRRPELNCLKCHAIAGAGGLVGPDLSSIGASAQPDYVLESLIHPNAKIKEGYNTLTVITQEDRVVSGVRVRENGQELVLRDAEGAEIRVPVADIAERKNGLSLMPEGLVDPLPREELRDLTRFLSELGKGKYAATPGRVVRRWEALKPTAAMYEALNRQRLGAVAAAGSALEFNAVYSLVSGDLPLDAAPQFKWNNTAPKIAVVRTQIEVTTPGKVKLTTPDAAGLTVWMDGTPTEAAAAWTFDLARGTHTLTLAVDMAKHPGALRVELADAGAGGAGVSLVGGR